MAALTAEFLYTTERSRLLLATSRETMKALQRQLVNAKQQLTTSKQLVARAASLSAHSFHDPIPPAPEADGSELHAKGTVQTFAAVTELIEQVERSTAQDDCVSGRLFEDIVLAVGTGIDPFLLIGMLLEGMAQTVERLPVPERRDTAIVLCSLLWDRINDSQV